MWEAGFLELVLFLYIYLDSRIELWSSDLQIKHFYPLNHLSGLEHNFGVKKQNKIKQKADLHYQLQCMNSADSAP